MFIFYFILNYKFSFFDARKWNWNDRIKLFIDSRRNRPTQFYSCANTEPWDAYDKFNIRKTTTSARALAKSRAARKISFRGKWRVLFDFVCLCCIVLDKSSWIRHQRDWHSWSQEQRTINNMIIKLPIKKWS